MRLEVHPGREGSMGIGIAVRAEQFAATLVVARNIMAQSLARPVDTAAIFLDQGTSLMQLVKRSLVVSFFSKTQVGCRPLFALSRLWEG